MRSGMVRRLGRASVVALAIVALAAPTALAKRQFLEVEPFKKIKRTAGSTANRAMNEAEKATSGTVAEEITAVIRELAEKIESELLGIGSRPKPRDETERTPIFRGDRDPVPDKVLSSNASAVVERLLHKEGVPATSEFSPAPAPVAAAASDRRGWLDYLSQAAETLPRYTFPIALAAIVAIFLAMNGRIDRKDSKLLVAPVDSDQGLLTFK